MLCACACVRVCTLLGDVPVRACRKWYPQAWCCSEADCAGWSLLDDLDCHLHPGQRCCMLFPHGRHLQPVGPSDPRRKEVVSATATRMPWRCTSDAACQLNGKCQSDGTCSCDPTWTGANCSSLVLGGSRRAYTGRVKDTTACLLWPALFRHSPNTFLFLGYLRLPVCFHVQGVVFHTNTVTCCGCSN